MASPMLRKTIQIIQRLFSFTDYSQLHKDRLFFVRCLAPSLSRSVPDCEHSGDCMTALRAEFDELMSAITDFVHCSQH